MNVVIETLINRRSTRSFTAEKVAPELINTIIQAGLHAPSGSNHQVVRLFIMQNPQTVSALNQLLVEAFSSIELNPESYHNHLAVRARQPGCNFFYHAPVLISAVAPKAHPNSMADSAATLQNMLIAAAALNLGACWINQPHWQTQNPQVRKIFEELGMHDDDDIFGSIILGHSESIPATPLPRKPNRICSDTVYG